MTKRTVRIPVQEDTRDKLNALKRAESYNDYLVRSLNLHQIDLPEVDTK